MKSRNFWIFLALLAVTFTTASAVHKKSVAATLPASASAPIGVVNPNVSGPYYALCSDKSHGGGCAGSETWCGPERDNYAAAKADVDAHKKDNPSHSVTVYHVP
jgi:hypothetical protein